MNAPTPFWRSEPLTEAESKLLELTLAAHDACARRMNVSTAFLLTSARSKLPLQTALATALLSLGGDHGPVERTCEVLTRKKLVYELLATNQKIPGWGSSFVKEGPDPIFEPLRTFLMEQFPETLAKIDHVTTKLKENGHNLEPNASAYTAAVALTLKIPKQIAIWLLIVGRMPIWTKLYLDKK